MVPSQVPVLASFSNSPHMALAGEDLGKRLEPVKEQENPTWIKSTRCAQEIAQETAKGS